MYRHPLAGASAVLVLALAAAAAGAQSAADPPLPPGRELILPASEVKDTFFAWLVGVVDAGRDAELDNAALRDVLTEFRSSIALPFDRISRVRHEAPRPDGYGSLGILFDGDVDIPVPFSLLWYHPGSLRSTRAIRFDERRFASLPTASSPAEPVYSFRLVEGTMAIDVDKWLDVLLGRIVDDLSIRIVAIARWRGSWRCLIGGTGREDRRIIAAFDLVRNTITFPVPSELTRLGLWLWNAR
ncbi:MAG: hypothetical protein A2177_07865 [Spirochaetes bacterium RBG_13_68_11]|nr:MAG: hypothetical protein A2177_07865 [Spirochaetes bacterium RBG_13_68_11]